MPEIKLKPCPFCGSETAPEIFTLAEIACHDEDEATEFERSHFAVACNYSRGGCGCSTGGICETEEEAARRWNQRAVRHAHWIKIDEDCRGYSSIFDCSGCGETTYLELPAKKCDYDFCPSCGAEMDGGADNG